MPAAEPGHVPVLVDEIMRLLQPRPGEVAVDCTAGRGGHSALLAEAVGPGGRVIGLDLDAENLGFAAERVRASVAGANFTPIHANFRDAPVHIAALGLRADVVLADLGFASTQIDNPARGFSMFDDGPLDMRYDPQAPATAAQLVARLSERELADLIYTCGEEPYSRRIARKVVEARRVEPIRSTARLAELVKEAYGPRARFSRLHPATRTFMALRIAVNDELGSLESLLAEITQAAERMTADERSWLAACARVGIVSFHSLEDRLVKRAFADLAKRGLAEKLTPGGKPVTAGEQEAQANPRSRSAKLRAIRIGRSADETGQDGWDRSRGRRVRKSES
jgi:16S rRNA (cytosine1402-N4)-methyltransferase